MKSARFSKLTSNRADEHKECAELAESKCLYNSAVSRYYYYCLLLAKAYIIRKDDITDESYFKNKNAHQAISELLNRIAQEHSPDEYPDVSTELNLGRLKMHRNNADYNGAMCYKKRQDEYKDFFNMVEEFVDAIEQIIKGEKK